MKKSCNLIRGFIKKSELDRAVRENFWYIKETPAVFATFHPFMIGFSLLSKHFPKFYEYNIVASGNGYGWYYAMEKDALAVGKMLYEGFLEDCSWLFGKKDEWRHRDLSKLHKVGEQVNRLNLSKLANDELVNVYEDFLESFYFAWAIPLIYEMNMVYVEQVLAPKLRNDPNLSDAEFNKVMAILSAPLKFSYMTVERLELLKLALNFSKKTLDAHFAKYYWMKSTYRRMVLYSKEEIKRLVKTELAKGLDHVRQEIENLEKAPKELGVKQRELIKKYKVSAKDQVLFETMGFLGDWQDKRKAMNIYGNHLLFVLLSEIAKRLELGLDLLCGALPSEVVDFLQGKDRLNPAELKRRFEYNMHVVDGDLHEIFLVGEEARDLKTILDRKIEERFKEVKGMVASIGEVPQIRGEVRVVFDPYGTDIPKGAILVTPMTRPEFIHLIHKAGAIVTDEGGVTSHAAIVSREFGVPCIVGTGTATKLLKDGDLVEVDTESGTVTKL